MDFKEIQEALRNGIEPSPDYPDLPNDYTAQELIAFDPKAELEYRLAKDRDPGMTRAMLMQNWRAFRIGRFFNNNHNDDRGTQQDGGGLSGFLRKVAETMKKR